ncbi:MAG: hypothetical protein H6922_04995 [Pseudomonadaceae bacterium]|nr:hypothetical protein [Pseudomonadaceae bacterium]
MQTDTLRRSTFVISALSILPHVFCCGIPAVAGLISLGTTVGLGAVLAANPLYKLVDAYHTELLTLAVAGVLMSGVFNLIAYQIDCRKAACTHGSCAPTKLRSFRIFLISLALLAVDLTWFAVEEEVLALHHHAEDAAH